MKLITSWKKFIGWTMLDLVGPIMNVFEYFYTYWNNSWIVLIGWCDSMGWVKEYLNGVKGQWLNIVKTSIMSFKKFLDVYCIFIGLLSSLSKCYIDILET